MEANGLKIHYWKTRGLIQPIIYLLEYTNTRYEIVDIASNKEYQKSKRKLVKGGLLFPSLPYLTDGKKKVSGIEAVEAYILEKSNAIDLLPSVEILDEFFNVSEVISRLTNGVNKCCYGPGKRNGVKARYKDFVAENINIFESLDLLVKKRGWVLKELSLLDFNLCELVEKVLAMEKAFKVNQVSKLDGLRDLFERVSELPRVKEYRGTAAFRGRPWNKKNAGWN